MRPGFAARAGLIPMLLAAAIAPAAVRAEDRKAEQVLEEIDAVKRPDFGAVDRDDRAAVEAYVKASQAAAKRRGELTLELYRVDPDNDRLPRLFEERWSSMPPVGSKADELMKELDEVAAGAKGEALRAQAAFFKVRALMFRGGEDTDKVLAAANDFAAKFPKDPRIGSILYSLSRREQDEHKRTALEDRLIKALPDSPYAGMIEGSRRRREAIGKPFELKFNDAVSGREVSMEDLKGKVVVVDFWATWCGPCVGEMPNMKRLYSEYKDKGVEFIGVSLDQPESDGGLKALKKFVGENEIPWPQYYQGKGWESDFSSKWGIDAIPALFVVDTKGNLHSVEARGKLETMIPELLKARSE